MGGGVGAEWGPARELSMAPSQPLLERPGEAHVSSQPLTSGPGPTFFISPAGAQSAARPKFLKEWVHL